MSLTISISFHELILHIRSVFANIHDSLNYIWMFSAHTIDCINAATSGSTLSTHLTGHGSTKDPVTYSRYFTSYATLTCFTRWYPTFLQILMHSYSNQKQTVLLLIDVPIQDRSWQITIHKGLTLSIPHGNFSAHYDINTKYLGITKDATMVVELSTTQFWVCKWSIL